MSSSVLTPSRRPAWLVPVAVVLAAALLATVSWLAGRDAQGGAEAAAPAAPGATSDGPAAGVVEQPAVPDLPRRDPADPLAYGPADAPVALIVYSDYQCPFCASWSSTTLPVMLEHADAGELRIEFRDIQAFGADSTRAAQAAYAAGLQGRYLDYHEALFEGGEKRPASGLTTEALVALAGELGLDTDRFTTDLASDAVAAGVQSAVDEANSIGAYSTPAFLLGGTPLLGAQPTEVFESVLQDELSDAKG